MIKHTLIGVEFADAFAELMPTIMNCNLDLRIETDPQGALLIGDADHIAYLFEAHDLD